METLRNIGDFMKMSNMEVIELTGEKDCLTQAELEIGNLKADDYNENGIFTRIITQFSWGSRYNPPFVHSSQALSAVVATMGKLGKWNVFSFSKEKFI